MKDRAAVESGGCTVPADHDHRPAYDEHSSLFPKGSSPKDDPGRFEARGWGCGEGLLHDLHDKGEPSKLRWWARCRGCGRSFDASSESSLNAKLKAHQEATR